MSVRDRQGSQRPSRVRRCTPGVCPAFETLETRLLLEAVSAAQAWQAGLGFLGVDAGEAARVSALEPWSVDAKTGPRAVPGDDGSVLAWVVEPGPEGFVIVAGDTDLPPVLGYADTGSFPFDDVPQNTLLHLVRSDVTDRMAFLDTSTVEAARYAADSNARWAVYLRAEAELLKGEGPLGVTQWGPLITFSTFNQTAPYNQYCPNDPTGTRSYTGCTPTAFTQLLYYWEYPFGLNFQYASDHYTSSGANGNVLIDDDAALRDFPTFAQLNAALGSIAYDFSASEIAYVMFATGIALNADYSSVETSAGLSTSDFTTGFGFVSAQWNSGWNTTVRDELIGNVRAGRPVYMSITRPGSGHSVIVDGYKDTGEFHLNLGWGGYADAWYFLPDVDTGVYHYTAVSSSISDVAPLVMTSQATPGSWSRGSTVPLRWNTSAGVGPNVAIELYRDGVLESTLAAATANDGVYDWTIPGTQPVGSGYTVRVVSTTNAAHFARSEASFSIERCELPAADYVGSLYAGLLRRAAGAAETAWGVSVLAGGVSRAELAAYFATTQPEFAACVAPVIRLYRAYLDRCPDDAGLTAWANALRAGVPLSAITIAFASSPEFVGLHGNVYWQSDNTTFVTWLYNTVLERAPDAGGLNAWRSALDNAWTTRDGMMVLFSQSGEYAAAHAGAVSVTMMYLGLLGRAAGAAEIDGWCAVMDGGATSTQVAWSFLQSNEYERNCVKTAMSWSMPVARLYQAYLGRDADYTGLTAWTGAYRAGMTLATIARGFLQSPEITALYGDVYAGYPSRQFVIFLYNRVLERDPSEGEIAVWQPALDNAWATREALAVMFTESAEYVTRTLSRARVTTVFQTLLFRMPDAGERLTWETWLVSHTLDEMLDQLLSP